MERPYRRHIVDYTRKEQPGTILVDTDARYLYFVLPGGKAIRYGVAVGEEALAWSGVATVGRMAEWPDWIPTPEIQARLGPRRRAVDCGRSNAAVSRWRRAATLRAADGYASQPVTSRLTFPVDRRAGYLGAF
jgi:hypothetical protein